MENEEIEAWLEEQVKQFKTVLPRYEKLCSTLEAILREAIKKYAPKAFIQARTKSIPSFAEKALRKREKYTDPLRRMTDLCGLRIIVPNLPEIEPVCNFIEKHFEIDWDNTVYVQQRLEPTEFGYCSTHYIVQMKKGAFPTKEISITPPSEVFPDEECPMKAEIQVRTLLMHAWADFEHDYTYKGIFKVPESWLRELARLAALLEDVDNQFAFIRERVKQYASSYGAYMTKEEIRKEMERLEIVLKYAPDDVEIAQRIGKLAIELEDWDKAIAVLSPFKDKGIKPILRDLGIAMCKKHKKNPQSPEYKKGQKYLEKACEPPTTDVDALCSLAGTYKGIDDEKAYELYLRAFQIDPSNAYPLGNCLEYEITKRKDISVIKLLQPVIESAIRRCREQVEVGMNLPWAYYDIGKFFLLIDKPIDSLIAHAKAIQISPSAWMVETSLKSIDKLSVVDNFLPEIGWVKNLHLIALAVKFNNNEAIKKLSGMVSDNFNPLKPPVVIITGGYDIRADEKMVALISEAFRDFEGTIILGGIAPEMRALIEEVLKERKIDIQIIDYAKGEEITPQEVLQYWVELSASRISPSDIKLLGFNGGDISALEYRIALALGIKVGVLQESGGAVEQLLKDAGWKSSKTLLPLPTDRMTIKAFIETPPPSLDPQIRETIAKAIHNEYLGSYWREMVQEKPPMVEWEELPENLKESNRQQADDILRKLKRIGCDIVKPVDRPVAQMEFTKDEIEIMAEMEHGRWNVERLSDGWRWGEKKDVDKKISPYLVGWDQLPENVKEWDREPVRAIPKLLESVGLEIRRKEEQSL
jgi:ppGpp synthetase/RelA/SpoT-type nucleotidyltranferase